MLEIRCSSLARHMKCGPGFSQFTNLPEYEAGDAAEEGTACGELLQAMLEQRALSPRVSTHAQNGVRFDEDMYFYAREIADRVLRHSTEEPVLCETRVDWQAHPGLKVRGSYDMAYALGDTLYIRDLKYGWGIVSVFENWQLLGYAVGEIIRRQRAFNHISFVIEQPRPYHEDGPTREWKITYAQLLQYKERIEARAAEIVSGMRSLSTGSQCKYCPAAASHCPAFNRAYHAALDFTLQDFKQGELTEKEIALQLDTLARAKEILKVKQDSMNQLANDKIKRGGIIPGWSTEESYGHRAWKPFVTPDAMQALTGMKITQETMLSPSQAEKLGVPRDLMKQLCFAPFKGMNLVKKDAGKLANKIFNQQGDN